MPKGKSPGKKGGTVSLAETAGVGPKKTAAKKTRKQSATARTIMSLVLVFVMIASVVAIFWGINFVKSNYLNTEDERVEVNTRLYRQTDEKYRDKMAYYVVALMGEDFSADLEAVSLICYNKENKTIDILQVPKSTYLGNDKKWAVNNLSSVWANPRPMVWCDYYNCRREVSEAEIKDGKHTVCNLEVIKKDGSASGDLCAVFNDLFGLPVDEYFVIPQKALVKLVNLNEGIVIELEADMEIDGISYKKGFQTITGQAALEYCLTKKNDASADIERMVKMRKVMFSLFSSLMSQTEEQLTSGSVGPIMLGSTPIRTKMLSKNLVALIREMSGVGKENITAYIMPGQTGKADKKTYYSANNSELLKLLNESFVPFGDKLKPDSLKLTELGKPGKAELRKQTMAEVLK